MADRPRACRDCGVTGIAGADRCLRCGGELVPRRRPLSPFGRAGDRRRVRRCAGIVLGILAVMTASEPSSLVTLAVTGVPPASEFSQVTPQDVQESCVGRHLPGDVAPARAPPAVIDGNPLSSWHCDGDGARLHPPQSLAVFFARPVTLAAIGIAGYDPLRPCRFVTAMELVIGAARFQVRLPASRYYPPLRWFAVPGAQADRLTLVVLGTTVPRGWHGPGCSRTTVAKVGFAVKR